MQAGQIITQKLIQKWYTYNMKRFITISILLIIAAFVFWFFYPLRSYVVMSVYSAQHESQSLMKKNNFKIDMPAGQGWYPFVMTYNADGFASWSGVDAKMSIMYNFGAFDPLTRTSELYDKDSDKYSSFYGAYVLQSDRVFGLSDGEIDMEQFALAVRYDYTQLVIRHFGCEEPVFQISDYSITDDIEYADIKGWARVDAKLQVNGAAHNFTQYKTPYLQYGRPMQKVDDDFEQTELTGRVYAKYFDEYDCTIMLYIIAPNTSAANSCDEDFLQYTQINSL